MTFLRLIYNLAFPLVLVAMLPWLCLRMVRRGKYRHKFGQRFAIYSNRVRARLGDGGRTWVHAVSVGELLIALKLIRALRARDPLRKFVLSTTTSTGFALANEQRSDWLEAIYFPLDFLPVTERALRIIRPREILLIEAEVWPNLVSRARARKIPTLLINARLSPRSEARFRKFRAFTGPIFNQLDAICVPDPEDVDRWTRLGVERAKLHQTGSIKFDDPPADAARRNFREILTAWGVPDSAPVLLAASTHAGEEELIARVFQGLRKVVPELHFVCVPRHAERAPAVRGELEALGLKTVLRSESPDGDMPDAILVNTTGELRDWYGCATVAVIGKSLLHKGGQNPAEPVMCGVPVVMGPHMRNFDVLVRQMVRHEGAIQVSRVEDLAGEILRLLQSEKRRAELVENGRRIIQSHQNATVRTCEVIERISPPHVSPPAAP